MNLIAKLGILWGFILAFVMCYFVYRRSVLRRISGKQIRFVNTRRRKNSTYYLYRILLATPIIRKGFRKLLARARVLFPSDDGSINKIVAKIILKALAVFLIILLLILLISGGDMVYIFFGTITAIVLFKGSVTKQLEKTEQEILTQFSEFLSGLISSYREMHGHLDDAIYSMLDEMPQLISLHMAAIYDVISAPDIEDAAERYTDYAPNHFLLSFVSLAVPVKVFGDKTLEDGNTAFLKGLITLKRELNEEIIKRERIDFAFSSLSTIAIAMIFTLKPIELFFKNFMPGSMPYFRSSMGITVMAIIFFLSYGCYTMILSLKTIRQNEEVDSTIWSRIASIPAINEILNIQMNRHYTSWMRIEKRLKTIGDHTGVKSFMVKSACFAVIAFISVNLLSVVAYKNAANNALTQIGDSWITPVVANVVDETYLEEMETVTLSMIEKHKNDTSLKADKIAVEVRSMLSGLKSDEIVNPIVETVRQQVGKYQGIYFRWYYELIAFGIAIVAFFIPLLFLKFQSNQTQMNKEDEINSFNLLALIFMDMDGIQISTILEWMRRFSYSYREAISDCIENLEMGEQKALTALYDYDNMPEFKRFVKALLAVDDLGFKRAFADIEIQRDYYNEKRKLDNQKLISKKSRTASRIAFIPIYSILILYLVLPMLYYSWTMFSQLGSIMGL